MSWSMLKRLFLHFEWAEAWLKGFFCTLNELKHDWKAFSALWMSWSMIERLFLHFEWAEACLKGLSEKPTIKRATLLANVFCTWLCLFSSKVIKQGMKMWQKKKHSINYTLNEPHSTKHTSQTKQMKYTKKHSQKHTEGCKWTFFNRI